MAIKLVRSSFFALVIFTFGTFFATAFAAGPPPKAVGSVEVVPISPCEGPCGASLRYTEFSAHEERDGKPDKGSMYWIQYGPESSTIEHWIDIDNVEIEGDCASFDGIATSTSDHDGDRLFVRVCDNGSPGKELDTFQLKWDGEAVWIYEVVDGNLLVH